MKKEYDIDLGGWKEFGPRTPNSYVLPGTNEILPGVDYHFTEATILKYLVA